MAYTQGYRDNVVIPDKYNTGCKGELTQFSETATVGTVTSGDGNSVKIVYDSAKSQIIINSYSNSNLANETLVENYDFSEFPFVTTNTANFKETKKVVFRNCKFKGITHDKNSVSNLYLEFERCTFSACVVGSNITMNKCYIGEDSTSDGMNAFKNYFVNDCLVAGLLSEANTNGTHVDGIQIYGHNSYEAGNIHLKNVRFSMPNFYYDGTSTSYVNASIMLKLEQNNANDITFEDIMVDMGGRYTPFYSTQPSGFTVTDVTFKDITVSDNYKDAESLFYTGSYNENTEVINVGCKSDLYVSSVWKDDEGKTHIICTNNSVLDARTLLVKTNLGEKNFTIDRSPNQTELLGVAEYQAYTYEDMPYDVECIIDENVNYIVCYDTEVSEENQIRFVEFSATQTYETVNDLFKGICDAIREKTQTSEPIKHTDIPEKIRLL